MTPGALATRESRSARRHDSVIASLAELGSRRARCASADGRQVLVSVSGRHRADRPSAAPAGNGSKRRLDGLEPDQRRTLLVAADLMSGIVDESVSSVRRARAKRAGMAEVSTSPTLRTRGSTTSATSTAWTAGPICPLARVW
jgi:hypothetical protein